MSSTTTIYHADGDYMTAGEIRDALDDASDVDDIKVTTTWSGRIKSLTVVKP